MMHQPWPPCRQKSHREAMVELSLSHEEEGLAEGVESREGGEERGGRGGTLEDNSIPPSEGASGSGDGAAEV